MEEKRERRPKFNWTNAYEINVRLSINALAKYQALCMQRRDTINHNNPGQKLLHL